MFSFASFVMLGLSACSDEDTPSVRTERRELSIHATFRPDEASGPSAKTGSPAGETRAYVWSLTDLNPFFLTAHTGAGAPLCSSTRFYRLPTSTGFTTDSTLYWPEALSQEVTFFATTGTDWNIGEDGKFTMRSGDPYDDIVTAYVSTSYAGTGHTGVLDLEFRHIMSNVKISLYGETAVGQNGQGDTIVSYTIHNIFFTGPSHQTYDFVTNTWTPATDEPNYSANVTHVFYDENMSVTTGAPGFRSSDSIAELAPSTIVAGANNCLPLIPGQYTIQVYYTNSYYSGTFKQVVRSEEISLTQGVTKKIRLNLPKKSANIFLDP